MHLEKKEPSALQRFCYSRVRSSSWSTSGRTGQQLRLLGIERSREQRPSSTARNIQRTPGCRNVEPKPTVGVEEELAERPPSLPRPLLRREARCTKPGSTFCSCPKLILE